MTPHDASTETESASDPHLESASIPSATVKETSAQPPFHSPPKSDELPPEGPSYPPTSWSPLIFRFLPTVTFIVFLLLLITLLEIFVRRSPYSAPSSSGLVFIWTYIPVGLVMAIGWIWDAYDLQIRALTPWAALNNTPTPATDAFLLDYIGASYFSGMWCALRHRHLLVLLGYFGFWMAGIAGIVSTSLWIVQENLHTSPTSLIRTSTLNTSAFNPSFSPTYDYMVSYIGRQAFGTSRPRWSTSDNIVMESISLPSGMSGDIVSFAGQTYGYSAALNCTKVTASFFANHLPSNYPPGFPNEDVQFGVDFDAEGCSGRYVEDGSTQTLGRNVKFNLGRVFNKTCVNSGSSSHINFLATASYINDTFLSPAVLSCTTTFTRSKVNVSVRPPNLPISSSIAAGTSESFNFPDGDTILSWLNTQNWDFLGDDPFTGIKTSNNGHTSDANSSFDPWFYIIYHGEGAAFNDFLDPGKLKNLSEKVFDGMWIDFAQNFVQPSSSRMEAEGSVAISRRLLMARPISARIAQATLASMALAILIAFLLRPRTNLPRDPSSVAAIASLLRPSEGEIRNAMHGVGAMSEKCMISRLECWNFFTTGQGRGFVIAADRASESNDIAPESQPSEMTFWCPFLLHWISQTVLILTICATIITLELLLRHSSSNDGISSVSTMLDTYSWSYVAPAYLFVLGLLLASYTFGIRTLLPFVLLHRAPQKATQTILYSPTAFTALGLSGHAIRHRSVVALACSGVLLLIPFLRIAVAGLFVVSFAPAQQTLHVLSTSTFNMTLDGGKLENEGFASETFALTRSNKFPLPLPAWATTDAAVGEVDFSNLNMLKLANVTTVIPLPVVKADLVNCTVLTQSDQKKGLAPLADKVWGLELPQQPVHTEGNTTVCDYNGDSVTDQGKQVAELWVPPEPGWLAEIHSEECGGYVIIFGRTDVSNASTFRDLTAIQCFDEMKLSTKNVTFHHSFNETAKIVSIDDTSERDQHIISNPRRNYPGKAFLFFDLPHQFAPFNDTDARTKNMDPFMQILVTSSSALPLEAYLDPTTLLREVRQSYSAYWAIFATQYQRIPVNPEGRQSVEAAVYSQKQRVMQERIPTRILQALLGFVLVCTLATAVFMVGDKVLPKAPYSIGSRMSLLADSFFSQLPELRNDMTDAELERVLEPYLFTLGWSEGVDGTARFGVDILKDVDAPSTP